MISQEQFEKLELEHGCGYWNVCWEHACPCAITVENKGLQESIYNSLKQEAEEVAREFDDDDLDYEPMARCRECGCIEREVDLEDGLCIGCYEDEEEEYEDSYPEPNCNDFKECENCKSCFYYDDRCTYLDSDTQLWLSGNEEDM